MIARNCKHQTGVSFPCPWPSCPAGTSKKQIDLLVTNKTGTRAMVSVVRKFLPGEERYLWVQEFRAA